MIRRMTLTSLLTVAVAVAFAPGCEKHENFPQPLGVAVPQTVNNLSVTTLDNIVFDLTWDVDDPSAVQVYRAYYILEGLPMPNLAGEGPTPQATIDFQVTVSGVTFGVSVVTPENVEGAMVLVTP